MASKSPRSSAKTKHDALSVLKEDHARVRKLFKDFQKLSDKDEEEKAELIQQACQMLTVHATIEEELFYPSLRGELEEEALLAEAEIEHTVAKQLIAELQEGDLDEQRRDAMFTVLCEYVEHHIEEEESDLFKQARKTEVDLEALGEELLSRKEDLEAEMGLMEAGTNNGAASRRRGRSAGSEARR